MSLDILGAITGIFVVVYDGQHALRFTLGRARAVVGPGIHFKVPLIQKFKVEETKHTTLDLEPQVIQLRDNLVYEVDCKVVYQIVNLRKAVIEIDDLVTGLQNRVVMAVQRVVAEKDRHSVTDIEMLCAQVREELKAVEDQWGVRILQFGFSNISPSPTTLEITQLELLANEKLKLYQRLTQEGLSEEAAVALLAGAVVSVQPHEPEETRRKTERADRATIELYQQEIKRSVEEQEKKSTGQPPAAKETEAEDSGASETEDET